MPKPAKLRDSQLVADREVHGTDTGSLQNTSSSPKEPVCAAERGVWAALQALTQVQRRVPQPISLVGIGPMVQEQLHWKWENPRGAVRGSYGLDPNPQP